jgi:hypothetical protein
MILFEETTHGRPGSDGVSVTKEELHQLIEELEEYQYDEAARTLQRLRELAHDPVYQAFMNALLDDEPLTAEERRLIDEAKAEIARGEVYRLEDILADLKKRRSAQ